MQHPPSSPESRRYLPEELARIVGAPTGARVFTLVDLAHRRCRIWEERRIKGAAEWAAANRRRAGGPVLSSVADGMTIRTEAKISPQPGVRAPPAFGPAEQGKGGEALDDCFLRGKDVITSWKGIGGAGLGLARALGLAQGVLEVKATGLEQAGGSSTVGLEIVTPALSRFLIGIDDTDSPMGGATWSLAQEVTAGLEDMAVLSQRVVQLYPGVPTKTTNCVATLIEAAVAPWMKEAVKIEIRDRLEASAKSPEVGLVFVEGLVIPAFDEVERFTHRARREIVTMKEAEAVAAAVHAHTMLDGRGLIGAVAAIGAAEMGPEAADLEL